jgi:DNA repair photolyase
MYVNDNFLYGTEERIFLNTNLGCSSNCSYCYLPSLNFEINNTPNNKLEPNRLINLLEGKSFFKKGKKGTILSIGCYSECWDESNKKDTISLINELLKYNNPIQIATKRQIKEKDLELILLDQVNYKHHLSFYISSTTISEHLIYEQKTTNPKDRFKSFDILKKYNLPSFLYMKPILKNITIKDLPEYIKVIKNNKIDVIIGELFCTLGVKDAPISNGKLKYSNQEEEDMKKITTEVSKYVNTYKYSTQPIIEELNK